MSDDYEDDTPLELPESLKGVERMTLQELKEKKPTELLSLAESLEIENASS